MSPVMEELGLSESKEGRAELGKTLRDLGD